MARARKLRNKPFIRLNAAQALLQDVYGVAVRRLKSLAIVPSTLQAVYEVAVRRWMSQFIHSQKLCNNQRMLNSGSTFLNGALTRYVFLKNAMTGTLRLCSLVGVETYFGLHLQSRRVLNLTPSTSLLLSYDVPWVSLHSENAVPCSRDCIMKEDCRRTLIYLLHK